MKRINANCIVLIIIVFLMVSAKVYSQNENTATQSLKDALIKLETSSWEAWKNRDGKFFEGFLSGDHVEIGFSGVTNKESVVRSVGSPSCIVKGYKIDGFELKIIDQTTALLTYHAWQELLAMASPFQPLFG